MPSKQRTYKLKLNEEEFLRLFDIITQKDKKDYYGYFNDPSKHIRGKIDSKEKKFKIERNLGPLRGSNSQFEGQYFAIEDEIHIKIVIRMPLFDLILGIGIVLFIFLLSKKIIQSLIIGLVLFVFSYFYFLYDSSILIDEFENKIKKYIK